MLGAWVPADSHGGLKGRQSAQPCFRSARSAGRSSRVPGTVSPCPYLPGAGHLCFSHWVLGQCPLGRRQLPASFEADLLVFGGDRFFPLAFLQKDSEPALGGWFLLAP